MDESQRLMEERANWLARHLDIYLDSGGREGHIVDLTDLGGGAETPTLVLRTIGRKSGRVLFAPLIYGRDGEDFIIIASKGGMATHPAWHLNLVETPSVEFQVGETAYRGSWSVAEGAERERLWTMMAADFPPYDEYKARAGRVIPVVRLHAEQKIPVFRRS